MNFNAEFSEIVKLRESLAESVRALNACEELLKDRRASEGIIRRVKIAQERSMRVLKETETVVKN